MKSLFSFVALTVLGSGLLAAEFQSEIDFTYLDGDLSDGFDSVGQKSLGLAYTYHFKPLDTSKGAWREAAFLNGSSYAELSYLDSELTDAADEVDTSGYGARARWVFLDENWIAGFGYRKTEASLAAQDSDFGDPDLDLKSYTFEFGKYIAEKTSLELAYARTDFSVSDSELDGSADLDEYTLMLRHYGKLADGIDYSAKVYWAYSDIGGDVDEDVNGSGSSYGIDFTVYPMPQLGLGVSFLESDDSIGGLLAELDFTAGDSVGVYVDWFARENIALSLAYVDGSLEIDGDFSAEADIETILFKATFRF